MKLHFYEKKISISKRKFKIGSVTIPKIFPRLILRISWTHFKELEEKVRDLNRVVATIQRKFLEGVQVLVFAMSGDTWFRNS